MAFYNLYDMQHHLSFKTDEEKNTFNQNMTEFISTCLKNPQETYWLALIHEIESLWHMEIKNVK